MLRKSFIALALLAGTTVAASAEDPVHEGSEVFKRCAVCHTVVKNGGNGLGPNLFGIAGRKAAAVPDFTYSPALKKSGVIWNDANLAKWAAGPARMVPGNKMVFPGITSKKQQANLVAYLKSLK